MTDDSKRLFIGNLPYEIDEDELAKKLDLAKYGKVVSVELIRDRDSNKPKGFGFVTYESIQNAENAIDALNGTDLDGRSIRVSSAVGRSSRRGDASGEERRGGGGYRTDGRQRGGGGDYGGGRYSGGGYRGGRY